MIDSRLFSYFEWVFKVLWRREESKRKHLLSIRARKRAIDGDIARTRSFSVADNDFNDTSGTVRLCLTTVVKVTTGVLNDQFASRQCRYMHRYNTAHNGTFSWWRRKFASCRMSCLHVEMLCEQKIRLTFIIWLSAGTLLRVTQQFV